MDTNNNSSGTTPVTPPATPPANDPSTGSGQALAAAPATPNPLTAAPALQMNKPEMNPAASAGIPQPAGASAGTVPPPPVVKHKGSHMHWVIILLIIAFFCGLALAVWYFQSQLQQMTPQKTTSQAPVTVPKKIVVGTDATFQPMEYVASGGAFMGYDIDLGTRIAEEWGTQIEYKNIPWDDLFNALDSKKIDMIISSVTITEERKKQYEFSENYLNAGQVIITRRENETINSAQSLQGKKIAVQQGTTNETEALKLTAATLVIRYPDFVQATQALVDGKADAILSDLPGGKGIITANPTLKIASDPFTNEYYGIVFRKGDTNVKKVNEILSVLRTKGILTDLRQKWFD